MGYCRRKPAFISPLASTLLASGKPMTELEKLQLIRSFNVAGVDEVSLQRHLFELNAELARKRELDAIERWVEKAFDFYQVEITIEKDIIVRDEFQAEICRLSIPELARHGSVTDDDLIFTLYDYLLQQKLVVAGSILTH